MRISCSLNIRPWERRACFTEEVADATPHKVLYGFLLDCPTLKYSLSDKESPCVGPALGEQALCFDAQERIASA